MTRIRLPDGIVFMDVRSYEEFSEVWHKAKKKKKPIELYWKSRKKISVNPFQILYISND